MLLAKLRQFYGVSRMLLGFTISTPPLPRSQRYGKLSAMIQYFKNWYVCEVDVMGCHLVVAIYAALTGRLLPHGSVVMRLWHGRQNA